MSEETKADAEVKVKADAEASKSATKTYSEEQFKELIVERDKAKDKLRKIEEDRKKAEEAKAIEEGKLKEVLASKEAELAVANKKAEAYEAQQQKLRESYLSKLSDEDKELASDIHDLDKLKKFVDKITPQQAESKSQEKWKPGSKVDKPTFKNATEFYKYLDENGLRVK